MEKMPQPASYPPLGPFWLDLYSQHQFMAYCLPRGKRLCQVALHQPAPGLPCAPGTAAPSLSLVLSTPPAQCSPWVLLAPQAS